MRFPVLLTLGSLLAPRSAAATDGAPSEAQRSASACVAEAGNNPVLAEALRVPGLVVGGEGRSFEGVRLTGLRELTVKQVWSLLGKKPLGPLSGDEVVVLLGALAQSGLFSAVTPGEADPDQAEGTLEIRLTENIVLQGASVRGLAEHPPEELLGHILQAPSDWEIERSRSPRPPGRRKLHARPRKKHHRWDDDDEEDEDDRAACPAPLPDAEWLARLDGTQLRPGIVWRGLPQGLERGLRFLIDDGYPLARLAASVSPAGALTVDADEGHLGSIEVRGLRPHLRTEVERQLGLRPGDIFSIAELRSALGRVMVRIPFLERDWRKHEERPFPELRQETTPGGGQRFTFEPPDLSGEADTERERAALERGRRGTVQDRSRDDDDADPDDESIFGDGNRYGMRFDEDGDFSWNWGHDARRSSRRRAAGAEVQVVGRDRVIVWLRTRRTELNGQLEQLFRHTPVTGFAPGLALSERFWDPNDRVHLTLDGAINLNTRRESRTAADGARFLERLSAQERVDWLLGLRIAIPALRIAELGVQLHTLTDTADRWRSAAVDSYLYSALFNRPDAEYFRRSGVDAFLTLHLADRLTLGGEYRLDRFDTLNPPGKVWTLFNRDEAAQPAAKVSDGEVGAMLFRLEWSSERTSLYQVGDIWRRPEESLVQRDRDDDPALTTLNTVEIGSPGLGGEARFKYLHFISDTQGVVYLGGHERLRLRLRAGGGHDLPLQKEEALGGWTALRGYEFKEFRGDGSLLGTLELRSPHWGGFLDVGSVHQAATGWLDPRLGAGATFYFDQHARFEVAWRLDGRARALPEARVLFGWTL